LKRALLLGLFLAPALAADPAPEEARAAVEKAFAEVVGSNYTKNEAVAVKISDMDPFPAEAVAEYLQDQDANRKWVAVRAIQYAGVRAGGAAKALGEALRVEMAGKSPGSERELSNALSALGPAGAPAIPAMLDVLATSLFYQCRDVAVVLAYSTGDEGRKALKAQLADKDTDRSQRIFKCLEDSCSGGAISSLLEEVLRDETDPRARLAAARAAHLKIFDQNRIFPVLRRSLLEDADPAVRAECAAGLAEISPGDADLREAALVSLRAAEKEDPDEKARAAATKAVAALSARR
jgi:hypothetical protein